MNDIVINGFCQIVFRGNDKMPVRVRKKLKYALRHTTTATTTRLLRIFWNILLFVMHFFWVANKF